MFIMTQNIPTGAPPFFFFIILQNKGHFGKPLKKCNFKAHTKWLHAPACAGEIKTCMTFIWFDFTHVYQILTVYEAADCGIFYKTITVMKTKTKKKTFMNMRNTFIW